MANYRPSIVIGEFEPYFLVAMNLPHPLYAFVFYGTEIGHHCIDNDKHKTECRAQRESEAQKAEEISNDILARGWLKLAANHDGNLNARRELIEWIERKTAIKKKYSAPARRLSASAPADLNHWIYNLTVNM